LVHLLLGYSQVQDVSLTTSIKNFGDSEHVQIATPIKRFHIYMLNIN